MGEILRLASDPANSTLEVKKANIEALCIHLQGALRFHERVKKVRFYLSFSKSTRLHKWQVMGCTCK